MARWYYESPKSRFLSKVQISDENNCWEWLAGIDRKGYGRFHFKKAGKWKRGRAHRFSWLLFIGKIPKGMLVCHHCDNPACCNPRHLFVGTNQDNMTDRNRKNRQARLRGSMNGISKLTENSVLEIRRILKKRKSPKDRELSFPKIAKMYGVSRSTISAISTGQNWAWLK